MVQFAEVPLLIEETDSPLDLLMPADGSVAGRPLVFRRPLPPPSLSRGRLPVQTLIAQARCATQDQSSSSFGPCYGQLVVLFQPAIQWILSCFEYLLSTQGCRFVPRCAGEKLYCRGDYRVFTEADFNRLAHRAFKEVLLAHLAEPGTETHFEWDVRKNLWPKTAELYRLLEEPPDPRHRTLTGYSYLRCVPYRFLNDAHQERVIRVVEKLPQEERQVVELYYFRFYKEEAVLEETAISWHAFRRRRAKALRMIASFDPLSCALLSQIERY